VVLSFTFMNAENAVAFGVMTVGVATDDARTVVLKRKKMLDM
jgi:hypothetical protein